MSAKPGYRVERRAPEAAYDDLARIWGANLQLEATAAEKFAWMYRDAPDRPEAVFLLHAGDGDAGALAIGTAGVGIRRLAVGDRELRAGLLGDLAVDREHRSVMPALTLVREVKAWALGALDVAYGFPNKLAEGVFKRVGYKSLGTITRYARVLRHARYLDDVGDPELARLPAAARPVAKATLARPALASVIAHGIDAAVIARGGARLARAMSRLRLAWPAQLDDRLDALWAAARGDYAVVAPRTAQFLTWRFFRGPHSAMRSLALAVDRRGEPRAYAVIERTGDTAHLRDLFGHRADVADLLDRLVPALYRRGAASMSIRYLGAPWLVDVLAARGFAPRDSSRMIAYGVAERTDPAVAAQLADPAAWHLTDADEDI
jgi:hypothetical protein